MLKSNFVIFQFGDAVSDTRIRINDVTRTHIHHASGLECIKVEVIIHFGECISGVIVVREFLAAGNAMWF